MYLFIPFDGDTTQSPRPPNSEEMELIINGTLLVYRFSNDSFEQFVPIDENDIEAWTTVTIEV